MTPRPAVEVDEDVNFLLVDRLRCLLLGHVPDEDEGGAGARDRFPPRVLEPGALVCVESIAEGIHLLPPVRADQEQHLSSDGGAGEVRGYVSHPQGPCWVPAGERDVLEPLRHHRPGLQVCLLSELRARGEKRSQEKGGKEAGSERVGKRGYHESGGKRRKRKRGGAESWELGAGSWELGKKEAGGLRATCLQMARAAAGERG